MKLLLVGDFHGKIPKLKDKDFDIVLCTGDLADTDKIRKLMFKNWDEGKELFELVSKTKYKTLISNAVNSQDKILAWLNSLKKPVYLIYGNNDYSCESVSAVKYFKPESLNAKVKRFENVTLLKNRKISINRISILGFSGYMGFKNKFPKKENMKKAGMENNSWIRRLNNLFKNYNKKDFNIMLAHDPPRGVLDKIRNKNSPINGKSIGDEFFTKIIKKYQPEVMVCGHMHENQGKKKLGKTLVVNTGYAHDNHYAVMEVKSRGFSVKLV